MSLNFLSKQYNILREQIDKIESEASYYESVLLEYKGIECYVDDLSLYFGKVKLRVNNVDLDRFDGNKKTVEIMLEEFDSKVKVIRED
ncbi:hypothetical protein ABNX05_11110 [Lysinibacillus sp. M3]|uniref:Uncharacterized protein n=1 Tax=Lysinibacillus zambalensis TaxID=3160866 RepID=A0ABV1MRN5_9BACI